MTRARYEIEFQGTPRRHDLDRLPVPLQAAGRPPSAPGIYAPYQPRFEWNLWFASLGTWQEYPWVVERRGPAAARASPDVLALFRARPVRGAPPLAVRAVLWQYWFTSREERARTGAWWRREYQGLYAPEVRRDATGKTILDEPP